MPFGSQLHQDDYVVKSQCNQRDIYIGTKLIGGFPIGTAEWKIGHPFGRIDDMKTNSSVEYQDDKESFILDFTKDIQQVCPSEESTPTFLYRNSLPLKNSLPFVNRFVHIGRIVGRDDGDGGIIVLVKTMIGKVSSESR